VIGREARAQFVEQTGGLPTAVVACVGGGSNAMGLFDAFIEDRSVRLMGVEAGGGRHAAGRAASRSPGGLPAVLRRARALARRGRQETILVNLYGRGDKDVNTGESALAERARGPARPSSEVEREARSAEGRDRSVGREPGWGPASSK